MRTQMCTCAGVHTRAHTHTHTLRVCACPLDLPARTSKHRLAVRRRDNLFTCGEFSPELQLRSPRRCPSAHVCGSSQPWDKQARKDATLCICVYVLHTFIVPATSQQGLTDRSTPVDDGESSSSAIEAAHCPVLCGACRAAYQPGGDCCSRAAAISLGLQQRYSSSAAFAGSSVQFCLGIMRGVVSERESYIRPHFPVIATRPCQFNPLKPSIEDMDRSSITCRTCTEYRRCRLHRNAVVCRHCVCSQLCLHHSWELSSLSTQIRH